MLRFFMLIGAPICLALFFVSKYKPQESRKVMGALKEMAGVHEHQELLPSNARLAKPIEPTKLQNEKLPKDEPFLKLEYRKDDKVAIVPADNEITGVTILQGQPLRITLGNSSEYDIIRMYGAHESTFDSPNLVFDWTAREMTTFPFEKEFFKYKFYKVTWQSVIAGSKKKEAVFFIEGQAAKSPSLVLTYQPHDAGTVVKELSYLLQKDSQEQSTRLPGLRLRKDSLLGLKLVSQNQVIQNCVYIAPDTKKSDCRSWTEADYIGNIQNQDLGWHQVVVSTDLGQFQYQFEILSIQ